MITIYYYNHDEHMQISIPKTEFNSEVFEASKGSITTSTRINFYQKEELLLTQRKTGKWDRKQMIKSRDLLSQHSN
jgi:hypothetical protein